MRPLAPLAVVAVLAAGCASSHQADPATGSSTTKAAARPPRPKTPAQTALGLPAVPPGPVPGYVMVADRNNNRVLIISPSKRVVWRYDRLRGPDDAFFTPGYRSIITNEEFNETLTEVSLRSKRRIWRYGHDQVAGSSAGYLNTPDDAYRLPNGDTTVADIRNCRVVQLTRTKHVRRILGGSCAHDPPRGFASPNGDTPLPDGGLLVTEIGPPGWIDRIAPDGHLMWSVQSPVAYPSDAQLLPDRRILVASFVNPGRIVELTRTGHVTWSFGSDSGRNRLDQPSLAVRWPNGMIAANDDYGERIIVIDPHTKRIVWQYGHTGVAGTGLGYLNKPDGLDLLPATAAAATRAPTQSHAAKPRPKKARTPSLTVRRIGSLPSVTSRIAAVAVANGRILAAGGLVGGSSSDQVLLGPPEHLRVVGHLPAATHDAAMALVGGAAYLYGGGEAVSTNAVERIDTRTGQARAAHPLFEPLSDLAAAQLGKAAYLVGGYTGTQFATAVLRADTAGSSTVVARVAAGVRYAGAAGYRGRIYVVGGVTPGGVSRAIDVVDPVSHKVRSLGLLPRPIAHAPLVAFGGYLYLIGGSGADGRPRRQILRIDLHGGVARAGTLPHPLADAAAVAVGRRVVVLGGSDVLAFR